MTQTTTGVAVRWHATETVDLFSADAATEPMHGVLTTEHAASSYGQPVLVGDDGQVYGPGDLRATLHVGHDAMRCVYLADTLHADYGPDAPAPEGATWDAGEVRETARIIRAALAVGYRLAD